ncbi:MAG: RNA polymerase factor sigma-54 [Victivallales bacterium]|nr:RNA polymerase factor sigma-54 [Victivallales bacterium]
MKQSLKQEQVLAPAQLQSLEYLIAPVTELQTKIADELSTNPVLEQDRDKNERQQEASSEPLEANCPDTEFGREEAEYTADDDYSNFEQMAERWNNYLPTASAGGSTAEDNEKYNHFFNSIISPPSLEEQLTEQLNFSNADDSLKELCKLIIGSINEAGYFQGSLRDLAVIGGVGVEEMEKALKLVQTFEPPGIAARDLKECLFLQLKKSGRENSATADIVLNYLDELAENHLPQIAKKMNISLDELQKSVNEIRRLTPYPWIDTGANTEHTVVIPELSIEKIEGVYTVILKNEYIPQLKISKKYLNMLADPSIPKETKEYIKEKVLKGNLIIKNIQQRQETIRNIAEVIIDSQYDFLEKGIEYLKPQTMKEVADKINVHETTVSRASANKYVETPQGVFEMKYFFSTGYQSESGEIVSNKSVMEKIKDIIEDEDPYKPYSDEAVSKILKEQGLNVARRTVTKYREETGIPSSRQRKKFV